LKFKANIKIYAKPTQAASPSQTFQPLIGIQVIVYLAKPDTPSLEGK
jgi:hypothetical protein